MTCKTARAVIVSLQSLCFLMLPVNHPTIRPRKARSESVVSFVLGSLRNGFGLSACTFLRIVSLRVWSILS